MSDEPKRPRSARTPADPHSTEARAARAKEKQDFVGSLLAQGMAMVRVDARRPMVRVPPKFAEDPSLALNLSWRFPDARMVLNERGIAATLTFGGRPFRCGLPWSAIWGARLTRGGSLELWEPDLPVEMGGTPNGATADEVPVEPRPMLVKLEDVGDGEAVAPPPEAEPAAPRAPPKLRIVK